MARIVEQLGGQLRVDSKVGEGSRFSFLVAFAIDHDDVEASTARSIPTGSRSQDEIARLVHALASTSLQTSPRPSASRTNGVEKGTGSPDSSGSSVSQKQSSPRSTMSLSFEDPTVPLKLRILVVEVRAPYVYCSLCLTCTT